MKVEVAILGSPSVIIVLVVSFCGRKATLNLNELVPEPRSLVKVEVAILGSPSQIIVFMVSFCGCKATLNLNELVPEPRSCVKVEVESWAPRP